MPTVINPEIRVRVANIFDDVWDSAEEDTRLDIDIEVKKDLTGDPNQSVVRIYNLNDDTISILSSGGAPNIEIFYNLYGETAMTSCYLGEIASCYTANERPGSVTTLICECQRANLRDKYIELNYEGGTAFSLIIDAMTSKIGLPVQSVAIPDRNLPSAASFTGPAFLNLQELLKQVGMFAYIVDGVLHISSVFEPPLATIVEIKNTFLTQKPQPTTRRDVRDLWYTLATNADAAAAAANNFAANNGKVKKLSESQLLDRNKEIIKVDAVDVEIHGVSLEILGIPDLQPDTIINVEGDSAYYRIQWLQHTGDNHNGVLTTMQADAFEV